MRVVLYSFIYKPSLGRPCAKLARRLRDSGFWINQCLRYHELGHTAQEEKKKQQEKRKLVWNRSETSQNLQLTYLPEFHGTSYIGRSHDPVTLRLETQCLCQALIFIIAQGVLLSVPSRVKIFFGSSHCLLFLKMCLLLCSVLGPRRRGPWFLTS